MKCSVHEYRRSVVECNKCKNKMCSICLEVNHDYCNICNNYVMKNISRTDRVLFYLSGIILGIPVCYLFVFSYELLIHKGRGTNVIMDFILILFLLLLSMIFIYYYFWREIKIRLSREYIVVGFILMFISAMCTPFIVFALFFF
jgi:hypothetical protein